VRPATLATALLALGAAAGAAWVLVSGGTVAPPAPPPRVPPSRPAPPPRPSPEPAPADEPARAAAPGESEPPPGAWPLDPAPSWKAHVAALRAAVVDVPRRTATVDELLASCGDAAKVPVRASAALSRWAHETEATLEAGERAAEAVIEELAVRFNLEAVPGADGAVELHARGTGPDSRAARAARAAAAFERARAALASLEADPRSFARDPDAEAFRAQPVDGTSFEGVTLRDAALRLAKAHGVPVHLDRGPYNANPPLPLAGERPRTLGALVDAYANAASCEVDAGPRGIVFFDR
jgi:hypothetical protein